MRIYEKKHDTSLSRHAGLLVLVVLAVAVASFCTAFMVSFPFCYKFNSTPCNDIILYSALWFPAVTTVFAVCIASRKLYLRADRSLIKILNEAIAPALLILLSSLAVGLLMGLHTA